MSVLTANFATVIFRKPTITVFLMKKLLCMLPAMLMPFMALSAKTYVVKSPDKQYCPK